MDQESYNKWIEQLRQGLLKNSSLNVLEKFNEKNLNFNISGISDLAKHTLQSESLVNQLEKVQNELRISNETYLENLRKNSLYGLTENFRYLDSVNKEASKTLSDFASSHLILKDKLKKLYEAPNDLSKIGKSLEVTFSGWTNSYLNELKRNIDFEALNYATETNQLLSDKVEMISQNESKIEDLDKFKNDIISELSKLLDKTKSSKARDIIAHIMTIISTIITIYQFALSNAGKTENSKLIEETKEEIIQTIEEKNNESTKEIINLVEDRFKNLLKTRIATCNVNLREYPKKKSKIITVVKANQEVVVIEIVHKYLLIQYIDENNIPRSGYVVKKYFKSQK